MMPLTNTLLRGSYPPMITPFHDGHVDYGSFSELVERQVREGSHGIVVTGTTGEPSSLTVEERSELLKNAVGVVRGRVSVVAATGSQSLAETLRLTREAEKSGADAVLVVTPYYIKPSQQGLVEYFTAVGNSTALPLLIYHIPGRTAVSVTADTVSRTAERVPNLVGMKHAAPELDLISELLLSLGPDFRIFCGLEALSLPMLSIGACGLMNAVANLAPARVAALCNAVARGELAAARELHFELFELNRSLFVETNPVPLKYMMWRIGLIESAELRLPLVPLPEERRSVLDAVLRRAGLLQTVASPV